jgi:hypothetical protein
VVTAWEAYTPTITGTFLTSSAIQWCKYRRVGNNLEINLSVSATFSNAGDSFSTRITLPSGITSASDMRPQANRDIGFTQNNTVAGITVNSTDIQIIPTPGGGIFRNATYVIIGSTSIPIAEWAGSGTTTLADRAVEEFLSHDGSTTIYGPSGSLVPSTGGFTRTLNLLSNSSNTMSWILEFKSPESDIFYPAPISNSPFNQLISAFYNDGTADRGVMLQTNTNLTTVNVRFAGTPAVGQTWSALNSSGWRWRVRRLLGGAQVGYPISTKNIVGATDGVAPVTGMLGEVVRSQGSTSLSASTGTVNVTSIQIGAGTWILSGFIGSTLGADSITSMIVSDASGTGNTLTGITNGHDVGLAAQSTTGKVGSTPMLAYYTSSPRTIFLNFFRLNSVTATVGFHLSATRIA